MATLSWNPRGWAALSARRRNYVGGLQGNIRTKMIEWFGIWNGFESAVFWTGFSFRGFSIRWYPRDPQLTCQVDSVDLNVTVLWDRETDKAKRPSLAFHGWIKGNLFVDADGKIWWTAVMHLPQDAKVCSFLKILGAGYTRLFDTRTQFLTVHLNLERQKRFFQTCCLPDSELSKYVKRRECIDGCGRPKEWVQALSFFSPGRCELILK